MRQRWGYARCQELKSHLRPTPTLFLSLNLKKVAAGAAAAARVANLQRLLADRNKAGRQHGPMGRRAHEPSGLALSSGCPSYGSKLTLSMGLSTHTPLAVGDCGACAEFATHPLFT